ncbi:GNAT family N-acetyltransferase [Olsenella profusa]|nr:GNAT family N-acetyltransferase [Olsenella profusa]
MAPWGVLRDYRHVPAEWFDDFSCGNVHLDRWIRSQAMKDCLCGLCSCHVCVASDRSVSGFFTLSPTAVRPVDVSSGMRGGIRRLPIPAYLIGRLGVRTVLQGNGLGSRLLIEALRIVRDLARMGGGRLVIIDAKSEELAQWYEHFGFTRLKDNPLRLAMKMKTVERLVDEQTAHGL